MSDQAHWERLYTARPAEEQGWYEPHLQLSLKWIKALDLALDAPMVDVGGGTSTLVDDLLSAGHTAVTVLDLSEQALATARRRLDRTAAAVTWIHGDVTRIQLPHDHYALWHDRAAFHFLTAADEQRRYRENLLGSLRQGGHLIIGTFAEDAPPKCSGLPVQRYSPEGLQKALGPSLELMRHENVLHLTPSGVEQMYLYCHFRRAPDVG